MRNVNLLKELAKQLSEALPVQLDTLKKDFEKNCHKILQKAFAKFDLVTRDEFDTQTKVLLRTRKTLEDLEAQVAKLEKTLHSKTRK